MSPPNTTSLYDLLPEIHRRLDEREGFPLRALLSIIDAEHQRVEAAIDALVEDWFVETCPPATLPRIASLTGFEGRLAEGPEWRWLRSAVADTLACRRRKGTVNALERRLHGLTAWPAQAVMVERAERALGVLLWRKPVYPVMGGTPKRIAPGRFTFHPMGLDVPLFQLPEPRYCFDEPATAANLPLSLSRDHLPASAAAILRRVRTGSQAIEGHYKLTAADLSQWDLLAAHAIAPHTALVDPVLGRFALPDDGHHDDGLSVDYNYAFSGDLGGGPYPREHSAPHPDCWVAYVARNAQPNHGGRRFATLAEALRAFRKTPGDGLIRILDSATYALTEDDLIGGAPDGCGTLPLGHRTLTVESASGQIPCLHGELLVLGASPGMRVTLRGLWIDGPLKAGGELDLHIEHATLRPPVRAHHHHERHSGIRTTHGQHPALAIHLHRAICGPVRLPAHCAGFDAHDSILDAHGGRVISNTGEDPAGHLPPVHLSRATLIGEAATGASGLAVETGDNLALSNETASPVAVSTRFGDPSYAQLRLNAGPSILEGASNGSELGAFNFLEQPRRLRLLQEGLDGYVPHGVDAHVSFES